MSLLGSAGTGAYLGIVDSPDISIPHASPLYLVPAVALLDVLRSRSKCSIASSRALELRSSRDTGAVARVRPHAAHGIVRDVANAARSLHACRARIALESTCNEPQCLRNGPCLLGIAAPRLPWVLKAASGGGGASLACALRRSVPPAHL
jgi:hypothetical protein